MPQDCLGSWVESVSNHSTDGGSLACIISRSPRQNSRRRERKRDDRSGFVGTATEN